MENRFKHIADAYDVDIYVVEKMHNKNPENIYEELENYIKNRRDEQ